MSNDAYKHVMSKYADDGFSAAAVNVGTNLVSGAGLLGARVIQKLNNDTRRKALLEDLVTNDPILKQVPKKQLLEWYATMYNVAPSLSVDRGVVKETLQNFARFGKADIATLKTLAETEKAVSEAGKSRDQAHSWTNLIGI